MVKNVDLGRSLSVPFGSAGAPCVAAIAGTFDSLTQIGGTEPLSDMFFLSSTRGTGGDIGNFHSAWGVAFRYWAACAMTGRPESHDRLAAFSQGPAAHIESGVGGFPAANGANRRHHHSSLGTAAAPPQDREITSISFVTGGFLTAQTLFNRGPAASRTTTISCFSKPRPEICLDAEPRLRQNLVGRRLCWSSAGLGVEEWNLGPKDQRTSVEGILPGIKRFVFSYFRPRTGGRPARMCARSRSFLGQDS